LVAAVGQHDVGADAQGCREVQGVEASQMAPSPLLVTYTVSPACTSRSTALLLLRSSRCGIVLGIV
jgi:hypothetical protein